MNRTDAVRLALLIGVTDLHPQTSATCLMCFMVTLWRSGTVFYGSEAKCRKKGAGYEKGRIS